MAGLWIWEQIIKPAFEFLAEVGLWIWDIISNSLSFISDLGERIWNFIQNALGSIGKILGFASGGRPPVGQASIVAERGPELFVPDSSGTIIPNNKLGGGGGTTNIIVKDNRFNSEGDMRKMVDMISKMLAKKNQRSTVR